MSLKREFVGPIYPKGEVKASVPLAAILGCKFIIETIKGHTYTFKVKSIEGRLKVECLSGYDEKGMTRSTIKTMKYDCSFNDVLEIGSPLILNGEAKTSVITKIIIE